MFNLLYLSIRPEDTNAAMDPEGARARAEGIIRLCGELEAGLWPTQPASKGPLVRLLPPHVSVSAMHEAQFYFLVKFRILASLGDYREMVTTLKVALELVFPQKLAMKGTGALAPEPVTFAEIVSAAYFHIRYPWMVQGGEERKPFMDASEKAIAMITQGTFTISALLENTAW